MSGWDRLVQVGGVLVDLVLLVPALPERGGDVLATLSLTATGGGFTVLSAAARQGLRAASLGPHGTGPFGDRVRTDLARERIEVLLPATADGDTGFCVGLVETGGERTYATSPGVEGRMGPDDLAAAPLASGDVVHLSGYQLAAPHGPLLAEWFAALPQGVGAVFDPGPLIGGLPSGLLAAVLARADWVSANAREARILTGADSASVAAEAWRATGGLVVRDGADGCHVREPGAAPVHVPGAVPRSPVVDTGGAGDVHVGAFVAALAHGLPPVAAAARANAAAAWSVQRLGPGRGPTTDELTADAAAP